MHRRSFLGVLGLLAAPLATEAQQAAKIARIGWLGLDPDSAPHLRAAFLEGLRHLGHIEGRNLVIESRYNYGKLDRFPALAADLVALRVDVIVAPTTPSAVAAKHATRSVPIVFTSASDPVTTGLVTSLARPGGRSSSWSSTSRPPRLSASPSRRRCSSGPIR